MSLTECWLRRLAFFVVTLELALVSETESAEALDQGSRDPCNLMPEAASPPVTEIKLDQTYLVKQGPQ